METTEKQFQEIAAHLESIQGIYQKLFQMEALEQEQFILHYFASVCGKKEELKPIQTVCEGVLTTYPNGVNYYETTLIDEAIQRLEPAYKQVLPSSWFEKDLLFYRLGYAVLEDEFKIFAQYTLERRFQLIIENLQRILYNSFVNDPNFKGENPYYKRHYEDFQRSKKHTKAFLDSDFSNYIAFFRGN